MVTDALWAMTTVMAIPMPTPDATDTLRLVQWLSPAFPIGAFAYSQGLEAAIDQGDVTDAPTLTDWVTAVLSHGTGRLDAILLAHARDADADIAYLAALAHAYASGAERATELREQGRAFTTALSAITGQTLPPLPYPVAVGYVTRTLDVTTAQVVMLWLQGLAAQMVSAAVRFVPLGQTDGQTVLTRLAPLIARLAQDYADAPLAALSATTPGADLAAMRHETMEVRIFRS